MQSKAWGYTTFFFFFDSLDPCLWVLMTGEFSAIDNARNNQSRTGQRGHLEARAWDEGYLGPKGFTRCIKPKFYEDVWGGNPNWMSTGVHIHCIQSYVFYICPATSLQNSFSNLVRPGHRALNHVIMCNQWPKSIQQQQLTQRLAGQACHQSCLLFQVQTFSRYADHRTAVVRYKHDLPEIIIFQFNVSRGKQTNCAYANVDTPNRFLWTYWHTQLRWRIVAAIGNSIWCPCFTRLSRLSVLLNTVLEKPRNTHEGASMKLPMSESTDLLAVSWWHQVQFQLGRLGLLRSTEWPISNLSYSYSASS